MTTQYANPQMLIRDLQQREPGARKEFQEWMHGPVHRLMEELRDRYQLPHDVNRLTRHALHAAETFLRSAGLKNFSTLTRQSFQAMVLLYLAKQVYQPFGQKMEQGDPPEHLPDCDHYSFETIFLPYEKVGAFWYGGDWFGGMKDSSGAIWLLIADITGHGYYAYLLSSALPLLWRQCWSGVNGTVPNPHQVLSRLHEMVEGCLPDGMYVECTLLRLAPNGEVTIAPAGGTRLLLRSRRQKRWDFLKLRGLWLGLDFPLEDDQHTCVMEEGDELIVGSDGIFDQLIEHSHSPDLRDVLTLNPSGTLLEQVQSALDEALQSQPQKDDITIVQIRRS